MSKNTCCACGDFPWEGRGATKDISGCRFSLYPMTNDFVPLILNALDKTDTGKVWSRSDALSTVYRGKLIHIFDAVRGLFVSAYSDGVHMALEAQVSKGCPGDTDGDSFLETDDLRINKPKLLDIHFPVLCKLALYPLGSGDYINHIAHVVRMAESAKLNPASVHYATRIAGDIHDVMDFLEAACEYIQNHVPHYVLTYTLSVNSPTEEKKNEKI